MCSLLFPLQEPFICPRRKALRRAQSREASGGSRGWRWRQRGGVRVKEGGIIATSFTIYPEEGGGYYFSVRVLFQPQTDVILSGNSLILHREAQREPHRNFIIINIITDIGIIIIL